MFYDVTFTSQGETISIHAIEGETPDHALEIAIDTFKKKFNVRVKREDYVSVKPHAGY